MADYVDDERCGVVVPNLTEDAVEAAVDRLMNGYDGYQRRAHEVGRRDFSLQAMLDRYRQVYESCGYVSQEAVN